MEDLHDQEVCDQELTEQRSQEILAEINNKLSSEFTILSNKDQMITLTPNDLIEHYTDMVKYLMKEMIKIENKNEENLYKIQIYLSMLLSILDSNPDIEDHQIFFESIFGKMKINDFIEWLRVLRF